MTTEASLPSVLMFHEHGHLVVSVQSPLSDDQWRTLCGRVLAHARRTSGLVLDLKGLDVLDSFSASMVGKLCKTIRVHGQEVVISGVPLPVYVTMTLRKLRVPDVPFVVDLGQAIDYLENRPSSRTRAAIPHQQDTQSGRSYLGEPAPPPRGRG